MRTPPTQDQLFKRVMIISLTIGVLLGILLTLVGLSLIASYIGALFLAESLRGGLSDFFYPYYLLIGGAAMVLAAKLSAVRRHLQPPAPSAERSATAWDLLGLILGIYLLLFGGILVIAGIFSLRIPGLVVVFLFPGGFFFSLLLVPVVDSRRRRKTAQR